MIKSLWENMETKQWQNVQIIQAQLKTILKWLDWKSILLRQSHFRGDEKHFLLHSRAVSINT